MAKKSLLVFLILFAASAVFAENKNTSVEAISSINWITREFKTDISENGKKFELVFQTDNKAYFEKMGKGIWLLMRYLFFPQKTDKTRYDSN